MVINLSCQTLCLELVCRLYHDLQHRESILASIDVDGGTAPLSLSLYDVQDTLFQRTLVTASIAIFAVVMLPFPIISPIS
jgi:hypothetical protein